MNLTEQLKALPKVELHLHLDGSVKPETLLELAEKEGIELPTRDLNQLKDLLMVTTQCNSLQEYLEKFKYPKMVMQRYDYLERIAYELSEQLAAENVRYVEVRFAPQFHTEQGLRLEQVVEAVLAGLKRGEVDFNLQTNLILCGMRHQTVEQNLEVVDLAARYQGQGVVGIDLAGDEQNYPVELHQQIFQQAKKLGLHITIHAGEAAGAGSVAKALQLGAERIGHGVRINENPELVDWIRIHQIPLEVCPLSNYQTKVVLEIRNHPVKEYFNQGIKVTINTDNRTVSNTSLTKEYQTIMEEEDFTLVQIKEMIINGAEAAFLPEAEKNQLIGDLKKELQI